MGKGGTTRSSKIAKIRGIVVNSLKLIKLIEDKGWTLHRTRGSHHHFKHSTLKGLVTIPHPKKDLPPKIEKSILSSWPTP